MDDVSYLQVLTFDVLPAGAGMEVDRIDFGGPD